MLLSDEPNAGGHLSGMRIQELEIASSQFMDSGISIVLTLVPGFLPQPVNINPI